MHAATSFYRPTLPAWENRAPSLRSRAPGDETLRSALLEALDLSQQSLCTTAGHDRLLGLLGGGAGGAVEALTRALVGAIEHNNDRRVGPVCALAARTLTSWPSAALAAVFLISLSCSLNTFCSPRRWSASFSVLTLVSLPTSPSSPQAPADRS